MKAETAMLLVGFANFKQKDVLENKTPSPEMGYGAADTRFGRWPTSAPEPSLAFPPLGEERHGGGLRSTAGAGCMRCARADTIA